jgi:hypothetical protein
MPDEVRDLCRVPQGVNENLVETGRNHIT